MKVRANRVVSYGGKEHAPGEEFEMKDKEAHAFIHSKRVITVEDKPRSMPAKPEATPPVDKGKKTKKKPDADDEDGKADKDDKGRYKRRDVRAEDEATREGED